MAGTNLGIHLSYLLRHNPGALELDMDRHENELLDGPEEQSEGEHKKQMLTLENRDER